MKEFTRSFFRATLKGYSEEGRRIRRRKGDLLAREWDIGEKKYETLRELDQAKRMMGRDARHVLIAYGLMRGRVYSRIENYARVKPNAEHVASVIVAFGTPEDAALWPLEKVQDELAGIGGGDPACTRSSSSETTV